MKDSDLLEIFDESPWNPRSKARKGTKGMARGRRREVDPDSGQEDVPTLVVGEIRPVFNHAWTRIDFVREKSAEKLHPGLACGGGSMAFGTSVFHVPHLSSILEVTHETHPFLFKDTYFLLKARLPLQPGDIAPGAKPKGLLQPEALASLRKKLAEVDRPSTFWDTPIDNPRCMMVGP